jgi:hypothetical protein
LLGLDLAGGVQGTSVVTVGTPPKRVHCGSDPRQIVSMTAPIFPTEVIVC